jgi:hypothetical protein
MKFALRVEILKFLQRFEIQRFGVGELNFGKILNPCVIQSILGGDSILRLKSQHLLDQVFCPLAHVSPLRIRKGEFSLLYSLEYQLIVFAIKRRITA